MFYHLFCVKYSSHSTIILIKDITQIIFTIITILTITTIITIITILTITTIITIISILTIITILIVLVTNFYSSHYLLFPTLLDASSHIFQCKNSHSLLFPLAYPAQLPNHLYRHPQVPYQ